MNIANSSAGLFFITRSVVLAIILSSGVTACSTSSAPRSDAQTAAELRKAADQGDAKAQYSLGLMFENGRVDDPSKTVLERALEQYGTVQQDYPQAVAWYRKAAKQGHAEAQFKLGLIYNKGRGVPKDYFQGKGVHKDYAQAVVWYSKAAEQGHAVAQNNLGAMYYNGSGVSQDYTQALTWFRKAADQGNANAIENVKLAESKIKVFERQKYLESPEGKEEIKTAEVKAKTEKKRTMSICDRFGHDASKKYNIGKYDGTLSSQRLGEDIYYCVTSFKQETVTGFMMPIYKGITLNNRTGVYEIESIN